MGYIREQIDRINEEINALEKARSRFQQSCLHESVAVIHYQWRLGSTMKAKCCQECDKIFPIRTNVEEVVTKFNSK